MASTAIPVALTLKEGPLEIRDDRVTWRAAAPNWRSTAARCARRRHHGIAAGYGARPGRPRGHRPRHRALDRALTRTAATPTKTGPGRWYLAGRAIRPPARWPCAAARCAPAAADALAPSMRIAVGSGGDSWIRPACRRPSPAWTTPAWSPWLHRCRPAHPPPRRRQRSSVRVATTSAATAWYACARTWRGSDSPTRPAGHRRRMRASGRTRLAIVNTGGLGTLTLGDGIEVIRAINGATTTAQTTRDAFALQEAGISPTRAPHQYRALSGRRRRARAKAGTRAHCARRAPCLRPFSVRRAHACRAGPHRSTSPRNRPVAAALPAMLAQMDLAMMGNLHRRKATVPLWPPWIPAHPAAAPGAA